MFRSIKEMEVFNVQIFATSLKRKPTSEEKFLRNLLQDLQKSCRRL